MTLLDYQNIKEDTALTIRVHSTPLLIDYHELDTFHRGDSWFGCTAGFRAMQGAAATFVKTSPWSRENLYLVSAQPGLGIKDAIDLVTHYINEKRFRLLDESETKACNRNMKFEWWLSNACIILHIKLHDDLVQEAFYQRLDRLNTDAELSDDRERFNPYKTNLSLQLWQQPLNAAFTIKLLPTPLCPRELPDVGELPCVGDLSHA